MVGMSGVPARLEPLLAPGSVAQRIAARLTEAGHECYLVGGTVRDALLGRDAVDVDLATDARPDAIEALLGPIASTVVTVGARFGTVRVIVDGVECEVTTFRSDVYLPESRKPEVQFGDDIETDLSRRDFTVNAMALRLPDPELIDPFEGAVDLAAGRLRTPLAPDVSFTDDPL